MGALQVGQGTPLTALGLAVFQLLKGGTRG